MAIGIPSNYLARHATDRITEALQDTRVVLLNGARQSGKSTLVRKVGKEIGAAWYTLDDPVTLEAAKRDPFSFVRLDDRMIIDEIQRLPELLLPIKALVDEEPTPGRFLLTGSARVLGLRDLPDTLIGRMETIELWPFSQGEIDGLPDNFIDSIFADPLGYRVESKLGRDDYIHRIERGGFPDVIHRSERRRSDYLENYLSDLVNRDVVQLSEIERGRELHDLVRLLAGYSGQTIAPTTLGSQIGLNSTTTARYLRLLEEVYLIKRIPAWTRRISARSTHQDKLAFVDSAVATTILGQSPVRLRKPGAPLGAMLETFVASELMRQLTWSETRASISHYRTKDRTEVDLLIENRAGEVIGIEVKATSSPVDNDFSGLRHLKNRIGSDFLAGIVLYTGRQTLSFGDDLRAIPVSAIWQGNFEKTGKP